MALSLETLCKNRKMHTVSNGRPNYGKKRSKLEVTVERFQFLGSAGGGGRGGGGGGGGRNSRDAQRQETSGEQEQKAPEYDYDQDVEDDTIPF